MCVVVGGVEVEVAPMWFCDATRLDGGAPQYRRRCFRVGMARSAAWTNERGSSTTPPYTPSPLSVAPEHPPLFTSRIQPQSAILLYLVI